MFMENDVVNNGGVLKKFMMVICIGNVKHVYKRDMILNKNKRRGMEYDIAWHSKDFIFEQERSCGLGKQGKKIALNPLFSVWEILWKHVRLQHIRKTLLSCAFTNYNSEHKPIYVDGI